ncbi:hypothetical protein AZJ36_07595, partial [Streptococcus pneumoniae]
MNIIFDLGNVLIEWNKEKILSKICKNDLEYNLFNKVVFQSNLWIDLDNGKIRLEFLENQLIDEMGPVSYTHFRAHETSSQLVC